ncbi:hypothetical protein ACHAWU_009242 [Discostella pseudostelligera]|uniref:Uncharacterized protein n=1 Tax=Discostella pseudostelligera TaxID=259834 RepID=A0ABD3N3Q5_9STRA
MKHCIPLSVAYAKRIMVDGNNHLSTSGGAAFVHNMTTMSVGEEDHFLKDLEANCIQILARQFRFQPQQQQFRSKAITFVKDASEDDPVLIRSHNEQEAHFVEGPIATSGGSSNGTKRSTSSIAVSVSVSVSVSPDRPAKIARRFSNSSLSSNSTTTSNTPAACCLLPTSDDPLDEHFIMTLDSSHDIGRINPVHIIVRRQIFEVRRTANRGRVFFQCACCKHRPRAERAKLSTLAPQGVDSVYRAFVRFMMEHVSACPDIPGEIKSLDAKAKKVPNFGGGCGGRAVGMSGIKKYWASSARRMGLMDGLDGKSIVFIDPQDEEEAKLISDIEMK